MLPGSNRTRRSSSQQSSRLSGQSGSTPMENETPNNDNDSSQASAPHDEHDWLASGLNLSGDVDVDGDLAVSQAGLSKVHSLQPPELHRLVASSWIDRHGTITACSEISTQNPSTGPSLYYEHYSSE